MAKEGLFIISTCNYAVSLNISQCCNILIFTIIRAVQVVTFFFFEKRYFIKNKLNYLT